MENLAKKTVSGIYGEATEEQITGLLTFLNSHPEMKDQYPELKELMAPFTPAEAKPSKMTAIRTLRDRNGNIVEGPKSITLEPSSEEEMFREDTSLRQETQDFLNRLLRDKRMLREETRPIDRPKPAPAERIEVEKKGLDVQPETTTEFLSRIAGKQRFAPDITVKERVDNPPSPRL